VAALLSLAFAAPAVAGRDDEKTIKSLEERRIDVAPGGSIANSEEKARDNYRQFLDLVSDDPALRAEAMRRLADLELEASQARQLDGDPPVDGAGHEDAVALFNELLKAYPEYRQNDTVLYQLARAHELAGRTDDALRV
jgi:tetratricopeptide (TPR) repeat protein